MTVNEMFKELKHEIEKAIRNTENRVPYMSGSQYKKDMLKRKIEQYRSDVTIDHELNVISDEIFRYETEIADRMEKALDFFVVY